MNRTHKGVEGGAGRCRTIAEKEEYTDATRVNMAMIELDHARIIIGRAFARSTELDLRPLAVIVLDAGGNVKAFERQDGASNLRYEIAHAKAYGAIGFGMGTRGLWARAQQDPSFTASLNGVFGGALVAVPGGVLVTTQDGGLIGAVGVTGDTPDNDEQAAVAGVEAAGYRAETG